MTDLAAFLRARLQEDEQGAKGLLTAARMLGAEPDFYGAGGPAAEAHWQRHDPARVLTEVDAKRRIIDTHNYREPMEDSPTLGPAPAAEISYCPICQESECLTLRLLALPYADHPDYRPEWRP